MLVRLEEPAVVAEVADYLRGFDCDVSTVRGGALRVAFAPAVGTDGHDPDWLERIRLEAYVRTWNALHPTTRAVIADQPVEVPEPSS
jgi:hypothetical protein